MLYIQGCCWAFVAAAAVQVAVNLNVGWRSELSVQELIDCDKIDRGCAGGNQVSQSSCSVQFFIVRIN